VNRQQIRRLLESSGHIVAYRKHHCRFGDTFRPECTDCTYRGPLVLWHRAQAIGAEHALKSVGAWVAAR
jgi:hypothetical protein